IAQLWQQSPDARSAWRAIRQEVPRSHRVVMSVKGNVYDRSLDTEVMRFVRELMQGWKRPDSTVGRIKQRSANVWVDEAAHIDDATTLVGPVWIGAGRQLTTPLSIVGPQVLWDDAAARPPVENLQWQEIEPTPNFAAPIAIKRRTSLSRYS